MNPIIRQGDVILVPVASLPPNLEPVPMDGSRIVLAYGEVTGHAHAIHGSVVMPSPEEVVAGLMQRLKAQLLTDKQGNRFLEVTEAVSLTHEEHTAHQIPPGIYEVPVQVEYSAEMVRRVAD